MLPNPFWSDIQSQTRPSARPQAKNIIPYKTRLSRKKKSKETKKWTSNLGQSEIYIDPITKRYNLHIRSYARSSSSGDRTGKQEEERDKEMNNKNKNACPTRDDEKEEDEFAKEW